MQQTTNYNLNLPEGTDVVNPLVDYNPNFSTIDSAMKANANRTVGRATCIKSGTTHVVTRSNTGSNIINFTATGDWNAGDTMTIDSVVVSVFLPDGTAALDGAYLINSEVFGILNGTRFTLYSNIREAETAAETPYDNANSGLNATDVQGAIDEIDGRVDTINNDKLHYPILPKIFTALNDTFVLPLGWKRIDLTMSVSNEALCTTSLIPSDDYAAANMVYNDGTIRRARITKSGDVLTLNALTNADQVHVVVSM